DQPADHERPVQFQCHDLRQAALVQLQLRADHDHATARIVNALTEQVPAEATLLPLEHVAQGLQLAAAPAAERLPTLAVVDQAVDRFLKHALLVADDHIRRAKLQQALQTVVAVDHTAVEVVEVRRGKAAAVKLHHGAQVGRDHRQHGQDHPLRPVTALEQALDNAQAFGRLLAALLAARGADLVPQLRRELVEVHVPQNLEEGFGAHRGLEDLPVLLLQLAIARLAQELEHLQRHQLVARLGVGGVQALDTQFELVLNVLNLVGGFG